MRLTLVATLAAGAFAQNDDVGHLFSLLSTCENVTIESVESRGFSCLSVDSGAVAAAGNGTAAATLVCEDTKGWTDGSNGCAAYAQAEAEGAGWCEKSGDRGAARRACCACGGGQEKPYRFGVGDAIRYQESVAKEEDGGGRYGRLRDGVVEAVRPSPDYAYELRTRGRDPPVFLAEEAHAAAPPRSRDGLLIRPCDATDASDRAERLWRASAYAGSGSDGRETLAVLEHAVSGVRLSADIGDAQPWKTQSLKFPGEARTPEDPLSFVGDVLRLRNALDAGVPAWADVVTIARQRGDGGDSPDCLTSGAFGKPSFDKAEWTECGGDGDKGLPATMWRVACADDDARYEGDAALARIVDLLSRPARALEAMAPWAVLGVARAASARDCKAAFREMGRVLHPDKRAALASKIDDPAHIARADDLFSAAQNAYDGLKNSDEAAREKFRLDQEVDDGLFGSSRDVLELRMPGDVILDQSSGAARLNVTAAPTLWVVFLYNPTCMMSRAIAPLVELAARAVRAGPIPANVDIRVGAFACGHYGEAARSAKLKGYAAVFEDRVCRSFEPGFPETPRIAAAVESGGTPAWDAWRQSFGRVTVGDTLSNLPGRLAAFARREARLFASASTLDRAEDAPAFKEFQEANLNKTRAVLFVDGASALASSVEMALASRARGLRHAGVAVLVAECDADEDCDAAATPQIKIYGRESLGGRSLVDEPFEDLRDAEVAVSAAAATLYALAKTDGSLTEDTESFTPEDDLPPESCGGGGGGTAHPDATGELGAPDPRELGGPPTAAPGDVEPPKLSQRNAGKDTWANAGGTRSGPQGFYGGKPMGSIGRGGTAQIRS